jgi:hypothetical protein
VVSPLRHRIEQLGLAEVGRLYIEIPHTELDDDLMLAVWHGEDDDCSDLPLDLWWSLILAALDACDIGDDGKLWQLGDGPLDQIRDRDPSIETRTLEERSRNAKLARVFDVMREWLPREGVTSGFWFE